MNFFGELREKLASYLDPDKVEQIYQSYLIAEKAHEGQFRRSGDPYITHPVAVAVILADMHMDHQSIMAALMHDVIEDSAITKNAIKKQFGEAVAELVDGVSKLTQIHFESRAQAQAENFRKMLLAMVRDVRVIIVKLADRLHNMRTIQNMPPKKRRRIAKETLEIYAPIANRLGMHAVRIELEDLGFSALHPLRYRVLARAVKKARGNRKEILQAIKAKIKEILERHAVENVVVQGRQKHLYSIYKKMKTKHMSFADIMDVYAFRILVKETAVCYLALGAVHSLYKPFPERFKDYIAIPKANGYQSLHTTLFGPYGVPIEIQIRTEEMNKIAENGIAAHWLYKMGETAIDEAQVKAREWMTNLLELQQRTGSSAEFIENVKIDLFPEEVYVFTPKGDILELSRGATPVDFAYAVHSDIGNACVAAKVERRLAPLSTELCNGQTVEIITAPGARPNPAWLNFVATAKARSNIRHFLKTQKHEEAIILGRQLLNKALQDLHVSLDTIDINQLKHIATELSYKTVDLLFAAIGLGNQMSAVIATRLIEPDRLKNLSEQTVEVHPLVITGTEGLLITFAECCRPIPGDPIVGYLTAGRGITVHMEQCVVLQRKKKIPEKYLAIRWENHIQGEFKADVSVEVFNQRWVLAQLASVIAESDSNIENITVDPTDGQHMMIHLTLSVKNKEHLEQVMKKIRAMKVVEKVMRGK